MTKKLFLCSLISFIFLIITGFLSTFLYTQVYSNPNKELPLALISEIKPSGGTGKTTDEFIELYNPNSTSTDLLGWILAKQTKTASSTDWQTLVIFSTSTTLSGYGHLLVAHTDYTGNIEADVNYSGNSIADDNTIILFDNNGKIIDLVGYGKANNSESYNALAPTAQFLSIERLPGGEIDNRQDTNNNLIDFVRAIPSPQNLASEPTPSSNSGPPLLVNSKIPTSTTPVAQFSSSTTSDSTVEFVSSSILTTLYEDNYEGDEGDFLSATTTDTSISEKSFLPAMGSILITEFLPTPTATQNEFIELYNRTTEEISLLNWSLQDGGNSKTTLGGIIPPRQYLVIEKPRGNLNNGGDLISLTAFDGTVIDQVAYGDWNDEISSDNAPEPKPGFSLVRPNEDFDSNNSKIDFILTQIITPGFKNQIKIESIVNTTSPNLDVSIVSNPETTQTNDTIVKTTKETKVEKKEILKIKIGVDKIVDYGEPIILDASDTTGTGDISYVWEMGDGVILEGESVDYVYKESGYHIITLIATDSTGRRIKKVKVQVKEPGKRKSNENEAGALASDKKNKKDDKSENEKSIFVPIHALPEVKSNTTVSVTGFVAAEPDSYGRKKEFYVTDESNLGHGIRVVFQKEQPAITRGDKITVTGKYTAKKDESYITLARSDFLVVLHHDNEPVPQVEKISGLTRLAGGLVKVTGEITDTKKDYAIVDDNTGEIKVNGLKKQKIALNDTADITGVLLQSKDGLELHPRGVEDIFIHSPQKKLGLESTGEVSHNLFWRKYGIWFGFGLILFAIVIKKIAPVGKKIKSKADAVVATSK